MATYVLAYLGGLLTILSPCVLPILPLVFSHSGQSRRALALMLAGLSLTFAVVATAATLSVGWIAAASDTGRWVALAALAVVALTLVSERAAIALTNPFARTGSSIDAIARATRKPVGSLLSGAAIGLLWAPCAGPILALVIVGGRVAGTTAATFVLLALFGLGASTALAAVLLAGQRFTRLLHRSLSMDRIVRRSLGVAALLGVAFIASGWDRKLLARGNFIQTAAAEEILVRRLATSRAVRPTLGVSLDDFVAAPAVRLQDEGAMPEFATGREWINSAPLTTASLRGKVVLVDFWTFQCINCLNALPHVKDLYAKYKDQGLVVIGVHTPELPRERVPSNVRAAVKALGITYPVVIDGDFAIWKAWQNQYWPAAYFVDAKGRVRFHHFGEGKYEQQDAVVRALLDEARRAAAS